MINSTSPLDVVTLKFDTALAKRSPELGLSRVAHRDNFQVNTLRSTSKEIAIKDPAQRSKWPWELVWSVDYVDQRTHAAFMFVFAAKTMKQLAKPNDPTDGMAVWEHVHNAEVLYIADALQYAAGLSWVCKKHPSVDDDDSGPKFRGPGDNGPDGPTPPSL